MRSVITTDTPSFRECTARDAAQVAAFISQHWGSPEMISRGVKYDCSKLPGFGCFRGDSLAGLLTYHIEADAVQIVSIDAVPAQHGVGTRLIELCIAKARELNATRVWLITSNDNLEALRFYQRRRFELVTIHRDAITAARRQKPSIPLVGNYGIPIKDEIELEYRLLS